MIACSMEIIRAVVDSLEQLSTVIVAIMGFVTAMVVAKVTSGLELKKALCLQGGCHDGVSSLNQKSNLDNVSRRNCNER